MIHRLLGNTQSMTGRLELFFLLVSVVIGLLCFALVSGSLLWSEDRVGERRIMIDKKEAIEHFKNTSSEGEVKLDRLTTAYNDINLVPSYYRPFLEDKHHFLGEVGEEPYTRMIYMSTYMHGGEEHPVILISLIDEIEITWSEFSYVIGLVLVVVLVLMFVFGILLLRLSQRLIEPINTLKIQLDEHQGDTTKKFVVPSGSAKEFEALAAQLNDYRNQVNQVIKREQAFARYASHELRTPLTVMKGSSSLLARNSSTPFQERQVHRIQDATQQMSTMVDALLGLVRYERNSDDSPVRRISEQELRHIVLLSQAQADEKSLEFEVTVTGSPHTRATTAVLNIVLSNLIRNSIAATSKGKIYVEMSDDTLSVRDEGEGFSSVPDSEGHGLGLMIVDDLCRRYGWQFEVNTHPAGGCEALIHLASEHRDK
ncbi:HAMP domain-containing sensor histidine kinase [Vibrio sp. STUT-A11]|uniref:sensor histidine kinase n=1 Tax=Vibrio sp. STUT-A11 TaxID=2976236 RepID=UPI00222FC579|nr:HAMP domain-containing sensor histidine kinase [Vibrio sp. STUT-A11]BDR13049.1 two-component sensor histidine kinase [Vibrio sp. STUT-A11]